MLCAIAPAKDPATRILSGFLAFIDFLMMMNLNVPEDTEGKGGALQGIMTFCFRLIEHFLNFETADARWNTP